ncbi:glycosyltransferase [Belliella marina]|uniref:Glycosyltransferase n=1 Tax=Belliella marina TaxID=1644146 RepID=A0ABW4VPY4_9BACT
MKIVHLQYGSSSSGNYTITLHDLMKRNGIDSSVLSLFSTFTPDDFAIQKLGKFPNLKSSLDHKIQAKLNRENNKEFGNFSYPILGTDVSSHQLISTADIIYVHWVLGGYLNINSLIKLAQLGKPLIFVLHDMWTFTGGCHYSFECEKFKGTCGNCQVLPENKEKDRSKKLFLKKQKLFQKYNNLYFVAPSRWMEQNAKSASLLKNKNIWQIFNSVSSNFKQLPKRPDKFIKPDKTRKIIGFGANYINSPYKGFQYLLKALQILGELNISIDFEILVFGSNLSEEIIKEIPFKVHYTGYLTSEKEICAAYNSMDVFVVSSIADNLPTTILESLRCEVPVVGFETGGIPEMIEHKRNGYLAKFKSSEDLADGIIFCLKNEVRGKLKPEFEDEQVIAKHFRLFEAIK